MHGTEHPSAWVKRWSHLVKPRGVVLDVACGYGRHTRWFYELNHSLVAVDKAQAAIESIALAIPASACEAHVADLEGGPWPFTGRQFDAVVVTNYLWRPLLPTLLASLAPGGVLIYETFTQGNESVGKPSRADFLLRPGELLEICAGLKIVAFEEGFQSGEHAESPRFIQRVVAVCEVAALENTSKPPRYELL